MDSWTSDKSTETVKNAIREHVKKDSAQRGMERKYIKYILLKEYIHRHPFTFNAHLLVERCMQGTALHLSAFQTLNCCSSTFCSLEASMRIQAIKAEGDRGSWGAESKKGEVPRISTTTQSPKYIHSYIHTHLHAQTIHKKAKKKKELERAREEIKERERERERDSSAQMHTALQGGSWSRCRRAGAGLLLPLYSTTWGCYVRTPEGHMGYKRRDDKLQNKITREDSER